MKKAICLLLVAGIAASLVSCGGGSTTSSSTGSTSSTGGSTTSTSSGSTGGDVVVDYSDPANISAEKIQPSFFLTSDGYEGNEIVWNAIEAYTNIDFQVIPVPLASFSEKLATTLSSGDLPDIMGCRPPCTWPPLPMANVTALPVSTRLPVWTRLCSAAPTSSRSWV